MEKIFALLLFFASCTTMKSEFFSGATRHDSTLHYVFKAGKKLLKERTIGSGEEVVFWGFLILMLGIPFYVWLKSNN